MTWNWETALAAWGTGAWVVSVLVLYIANSAAAAARRDAQTARRHEAVCFEIRGKILKEWEERSAAYQEVRDSFFRDFKAMNRDHQECVRKLSEQIHDDLRASGRLVLPAIKREGPLS